jgi:LuxR family quorum sensing-dependent transcriptional regulator
MGPGRVNYDRLLTQLSELLDAPSEQRLFAVFADIVDRAGGTAFDLVTSERSMSGMVVRGLIGLCECHDLAGDRDAMATREAPLFWGLARVVGVHALGQFQVGDTREVSFIDGLLAPVPAEAARGRSLLLRIGTEDIDEELAHLLVILCLACTRRLGQLRTSEAEHRLSVRERQVLQWMAEGKSAEDVADILGISIATVMFHYRGVATRYGTLNRTHTVVEAMRRGALRLG